LCVDLVTLTQNKSEALPTILQQVDDKSICVGSEDGQIENARTKNYDI
jgi:hypothetical protein